MAYQQHTRRSVLAGSVGAAVISPAAEGRADTGPVFSALTVISIQQILARLDWAIAEGDSDAYAACFASEGEVHDDGRKYCGAEAIRSYAKEALAHWQYCSVQTHSLLVTEVSPNAYSAKTRLTLIQTAGVQAHCLPLVALHAKLEDLIQLTAGHPVILKRVVTDVVQRPLPW